jgi:hypothetical protein
LAACFAAVNDNQVLKFSPMAAFGIIRMYHEDNMGNVGMFRKRRNGMIGDALVAKSLPLLRNLTTCTCPTAFRYKYRSCRHLVSSLSPSVYDLHDEGAIATFHPYL